MEVLYKKLYEKYSTVKAKRFSQFDQPNKDLEKRFQEYLNAADAFVEQLMVENDKLRAESGDLRIENDKLRAESGDLRNEVASLRSAKDQKWEDSQKLLSEERRKKNSSEDSEEDGWNMKRAGQQTASLHKQLPAGADLPSCTECSGGDSTYPRIEVPGSDYMPHHRKDKGASSTKASLSRNKSFGSLGPIKGQNDSQRKMFSGSNIGRENFRKLLEPSQPQRPGIAPYRIVLRNIKNKITMKQKNSFWSHCFYATIL